MSHVSPPFRYLVGPHHFDNLISEPPADGVRCLFTFNGFDEGNFSATFYGGESFVHYRGRGAQRAWMKIQQPGTSIHWRTHENFGRIHPYRVELEISRARLVRLGFL